ncbi:MAG: cbb3-type cytochrome c oxidase subunit I [Pseudomonadota bacterium]|nr:cbb3-type cytochrome c oxidase subunit I [Pseudomonadota bacterium]
MAANEATTNQVGQLTADPGQRRLATAWLVLGITALALAGLFAILLVVARAPGTSALFPTQDFFRVALIVHVDQSVLIWFLAFAGVLWSLANAARRLSWIAFATATGGCLLVAAAPFFGAADPLLNNYVPVLDHPLFLVALAIFGLGALLQVIAYLPRVFGGLSWRDPPAVGIATAAIATLIAGISLLWTWSGLAPAWQGKAYYEYLFWGPGHVLQFAYTQLMLVAWLWLARAVGRPIGLPNRWQSAILVLGVLPLLLVVVLHALYAPDSAEARLGFTRLMQYGNGLAAVPIGLLLTIALIRRRGAAMTEPLRPEYRALVASLVLFFAGGALGAAIAGVNTIIPAHYHGSIVAVTLALMGLTYQLLPELGFGRAVGRMARWQPAVYGAGQLLHIAGLAASGAMGIQRKTAGAAQGLEGVWAKTFMGIMGLGGLLAVIGGILFVVVVLRAFAQGSGTGR